MIVRYRLIVNLVVIDTFISKSDSVNYAKEHHSVIGGEKVRHRYLESGTVLLITGKITDKIKDRKVLGIIIPVDAKDC